jgi:Domain of unknown function (DUF1854)
MDRPETTLNDFKSFRLVREADGSLSLVLDGDKRFSGISIVRAAPLSQPNNFICFLDSTGQEICMVRDLSHLSIEDRVLVERGLQIRYITSIIRRIISVRREAGTLYCEAETDRGLRELAVRNSDDSVRWMSEGRVLLIDVDGNRFEIPNIGTLDSKSARMLRQNLW